MCHPFPISSDDGDIKKLKITNLKYAIAHNGVFRLDGLKIQNGDSDTTSFIKTHLYPIYVAREEYATKNEDTTNFDCIIESLVNGCKLAILGDNGYTKRYGKGWQEENGCWYSNNSYKPYTYNFNWQATRWQPQTQTKQTQTPKTYTCKYDWEEDSGYYAGCYWWQGERVGKDEYDALKREQEKTNDWLSLLEAKK